MLCAVSGGCNLFAQQASPATNPAAPAAQSPATTKPIVLTDSDIVGLINHGLTDGQIIAIIRTHKNTFALHSGEQLMAAHTQYHVSTAVLREMAAAAPSEESRRAFADYVQLVNKSVNASAPATAKGLTNQDVYDMVAQKMPDTAIIHVVQSQPVAFHLFSTPDFDDAVKHNVSPALLGAMAYAAGPVAVAASKQYAVDVRNRQLAAENAHRDHIAYVRAEIKKECPGCLSIYFYEYDANQKSFIPNALPEGVRKDLIRYANLPYAAAHHIFLTAEPATADYQVIWTEQDNAFTFHSSHLDTGYSTSGDTVFVSHDEPYERMSHYYNFSVYALNERTDNPVLYKVHMQNVGMFIGRNHPDVDCWHDVEKFLQHYAEKQH